MKRKELRERYDAMVAKHNDLVVKINAADDKPPKMLAEADELLGDIRALEHEIEASDRDTDERRKAAIAAVSGGDFQPDDVIPPMSDTVVRSSRSTSGTMLSPSGRPQRFAQGPEGRLSGRGERVPAYAMGELLRAAAVGPGHWTSHEVKAQLTSDENHSGGYSVPTTWLARWVDASIEMSVLAARASRAIMDSESLNITTIEELPTIATKAQLDKFNASTVVFGGRKLEAFTAGCTILAAEELLQDSPNAPAQIQFAMQQALADWLDRVMLNGSGSAEPMGVLQRTDIEADDAVGDLDWEAIAAGWVELRRKIRRPGLLVLSPAQYNALYTLASGDGSTSQKGWVESPRHLEDLEIVPSVHCPDASGLLCDPLELMLGIRTGATAEASRTAGESFERYGVTLRAALRADFVPTRLDAFYRLGGLTDPS